MTLRDSIKLKYALIEPLARTSSSSTIFSTAQAGIDRPLVLKIFLPPLTQSGQNRFTEIAETAKALDHPHLVPLYDFGLSQDGTPYLVSERPEGISLSKLMHAKRKLDEAFVIAIFTQVCDALEYAIKLGVSCGDLSADNIYVADADSPTPYVRMLGIGTQRNAFEQDWSARSLIISADGPRYASPERCLGNSVDERSIIYSIGCLMYEAVHGSPAFQAADAIKTLFEHVNGSMPHFPAKVERLDFIIRRCLEKVPENRYKDLRSLRFQLEQETSAHDQMAGSVISRIESMPESLRKRHFRTVVMMIAAALCIWNITQYVHQLKNGHRKSNDGRADIKFRRYACPLAKCQETGCAPFSTYLK